MAELRFPVPPLRDDLVALRPWRAHDVPTVARWGSDPDIVRWTNLPPGTSEHAARLHHRWTEELRRAGTSIHFAIVAAADERRVIGSADMRLGPPLGVAELGYLVDPAHRRRGVAAAAVRLLTAWAVDRHRCRRVQILVHPGNVASRGVAECCGFRLEGILRGWSERNGVAEDRAMLAFIPPGRRSDP